MHRTTSRPLREIKWGRARLVILSGSSPEQKGNFWSLVLMIDNSVKVIPDGFETNMSRGNSLSDE